MHVAGEVLNETNDYLRLVRVTVNVFGTGGELIETGTTYVILDSVPPGERACFEVLVGTLSSWGSYDFEPLQYDDDGPLPLNLVVLNDSGVYNPSLQWYRILGQVRNDQGTRVEYVSPVITVYGAADSVLGCGSTYVASTHLNAGQTSSFETQFFGQRYANVASYRIQVDGRVTQVR